MTVRSFYEDLGVSIAPASAGEASVRCFANPDAHTHGDRNPSCSVNLITGAWCCHGCEKSGGPYDAALARGQSPREAMELLERHGLKDAAGGHGSSHEPLDRRFSGTEADVARYARALGERPEELRRLCDLRGWTPEVVKRRGLGIDEHGRVTFPLRDAGGALVGIVRHLPDPDARSGEPKSKADAGSRRTLFPTPETVREQDGFVFLVEGEPDALAAESGGLAAVGAPGVNGWKPSDAERFRDRRVVVVFDCDQPGRAGAKRAATHLSGVAREVRVLDLDRGRDDGYDVGDFLAEAHTDVERADAGRVFLRMAAEAPIFVPTTKEPTVVERKITLPFSTFDQLIAETPEEPEWIWVGYLAPGSTTLLAGVPKVGKSTLAFGLIEAVISGHPFLDRATRANGVLLLSEERHGTLAEKARRFNLDSAVSVLMRHEAHGVLWREVVEQATALCLERRLGLLVVDTWDKWVGLAGDAENQAGAVIKALEPLNDAAGQGIAVLIVAHQRKGGGSHGEGVRGSNALTGAVDVVTELERAPGIAPDRSTLRVLRGNSRYTATPDTITVDLTDAGYQGGADAESVQSEAQEARVLEAVDELRSATVADLIEATGLSGSTVRRHLPPLEKRGAIQSSGQGVKGDPVRWTVQPAGAKPLLVSVEPAETEEVAA